MIENPTRGPQPICIGCGKLIAFGIPWRNGCASMFGYEVKPLTPGDLKYLEWKRKKEAADV